MPRRLRQPARRRLRVVDLSYTMLHMNDMVAKSSGGTDHRGLALLAGSQDGLFTASQAESYGVARRLLSHHAKSGRYERLDRGLYLVPEIPGSPWREVVAAWLQAGADQAVVSHETALAIHDLSDVISDQIHITVPRARRSLRRPPGAIIHTRLEPFGDGDVQLRHFVRVTAPAVSILDCLEVGTGLEQIELAIRQAHERGWISPEDLRGRARDRGHRVERIVGQLLDAGAERA